MGVGGKRTDGRADAGAAPVGTKGANPEDGQAADQEGNGEEVALLDGPYGPYDPRPGAYGPDDIGGGPYNPDTGLRDWYKAPDTEDADTQPDDGVRVSWADIFTQWEAITLDLHEVFGVDTETGVLDQRTWAWLEARITDLINRPSRLRAGLGLPDDMTA